MPTRAALSLCVIAARRCPKADAICAQILSRQPPFGQKLVAQSQSFPRLSIETSDWQETPSDEGNLCSCKVSVSLANADAVVSKIAWSQVTVLTSTNDNVWIDFRRIR